MAEKTEQKLENKTEEKKSEEKKETKQEVIASEEKAKQDAEAVAEKKEEKKPEKIPTKKEEAIARGLALPLSKKHCMYICTFIKNKTIDSAISDLELVTKFKKLVPFKGEIPHRKGMMSGRYPIKAAKLLIKLLKTLKGNVLINGLEPEKTRIITAYANWASRPLRREGRKAKRTNVLIKAKEVEIE